MCRFLGGRDGRRTPGLRPRNTTRLRSRALDSAHRSSMVRSRTMKWNKNESRVGKHALALHGQLVDHSDSAAFVGDGLARAPIGMEGSCGSTEMPAET